MKVGKSKGKEIIVLWLVAIAVSSMMAGCGGIDDPYFLTYPLHEVGSPPRKIQQIQAKELERQRFEYEEYAWRHQTPNDKELYSGSLAPILVIKF